MYPCTVVVLILPLKRTAWLLSKRLAINILLTSVRLKLFKMTFPSQANIFNTHFFVVGVTCREAVNVFMQVLL